MKTSNPAENYLLSLDSKQSKITMTSNLNKVARLLDGSKSYLECNWSKLNYTTVLEIKNELADEGKSPATINTILAAIKSVSKEAWRLGELDVEEFQHIKEIKRYRGYRESSGRALTLNELNKMIDHCMLQEGPKALRDAAMITLIYSAGLRRSEAVSLKVTDYDADEMEIRVLGKGNKERINALNPRAIDVVNTWLDERGLEPGPLFVRIYKGGNKTLEQLSGQTIYDIIRQRYQESGLKRLTPHDLRKTFATQLLENGEDIFVVQDLMGHAMVETTKKYDRRGKDSKIKAAKSLPF